MNDQVNTRQTRAADPAVKLPEAVVRAAARATELSEQQRTNAGAQLSANQQFDAKPNNGAMTFVDMNSPTPPVPNNVQERPANPLLVTKQPQPQPQQQDNSQSKQYSESEFQAMVGRFTKAEEEKKNLINRINEQQRLLATLGGTSTNPNNQVGRGDVSFNAPQPRKYITEADVKEWSPELIDMARRAAREVAEAELAPVRGEIQQVRGSLGNVQQHVAQDATQQIYQRLHQEVGADWEAQNKDPGFVSWLDQIDPMTGQQRRIILKEAFDTGQASRVVGAFRQYRAELGLVPAQGTQRGNGSESAQGDLRFANGGNSGGRSDTTPTVDLTALVAPGRARPGQTQGSPDKPIITGAEIAEFYADVTKGRYAGHEEIYNQVQAQISEALREGRVRR